MSVDHAVRELEDNAFARFLDLGPFWSAVRMLSDQEVIDPAPQLARRVGSRLGAGQRFETALSAAVDEVLEESTRNSL